jgi:cyanophycinase
MAKTEGSGKGSECPTPKGIVVAIGGKENKGQLPGKDVPKENYTKLEILKCFAEVIGKKEPVLEVITTAGSQGEESYNEYRKLFHELGIPNVGHIRHTTRKEVLDNPMTERLERADAFFFSGGDQLLLTSLYGGSDLLYLLKKRYIHEPIVVGGTSAGAMALSTPMIYAGSQEVQQISGSIKVTTGFEFLKDVCIDTHFVDRSRFVRMAQVIATNPTCVGIGIEEDTAIIVRDGLQARVVGTGVITIIDGFHIQRSNVTDFVDEAPVSIHNLRVHLLSRNDEYTIPQINQPHK